MGGGTWGGLFGPEACRASRRTKKNENAVFDFFGSGGPEMHYTSKLRKQVDFWSSERSLFFGPLALKRAISPKASNPLFTQFREIVHFCHTPLAKGRHRATLWYFSGFFCQKIGDFLPFREKACFFSKRSRVGQGKKPGSFLQMSKSSNFLQLRKNAVFSSCKK